jgi:hypothetical protein
MVPWRRAADEFDGMPLLAESAADGPTKLSFELPCHFFWRYRGEQADVEDVSPASIHIEPVQLIRALVGKRRGEGNEQALRRLAIHHIDGPDVSYVPNNMNSSGSRIGPKVHMQDVVVVLTLMEIDCDRRGIVAV